MVLIHPPHCRGGDGGSGNDNSCSDVGSGCGNGDGRGKGNGNGGDVLGGKHGGNGSNGGNGGNGGNGTTMGVCNAILSGYADVINIGSHDDDNCAPAAPAIDGGNIDGGVNEI